MPEQSPIGAGERQRVVALLREEWGVLAELLGELDDVAWSTPALPGWDVHDVVAHLVGTERMLAGATVPTVPVEETDGPHVRNDIARANEAWVVALRSRTHAELLADFRSVTAERLAALEAMSDAELDAPSWTPAGNATYGRFMEIRVFDSWMHEQDVRAAVGRPGNEEGPVAEQCVGEVVRALGYIVGKRAGLPDGSSVSLRLTGPVERTVHVVVEGRAAVVDALPGAATAEVALSSSLFMRLAGGRVRAEDELGHVKLSGDVELARQVASHLAFTI
ncbi:MAG: maleylpyruvate isomerase family mycothiol-dependent enzyme [Actinomycetota bacterium]|jgi:uncharacterized protein (TIGR03083 family)|nr:maleylpyruvate isomerase family mycothiol-dependent enzyme [Actinomycetota bacterium]